MQDELTAAGPKCATYQPATRLPPACRPPAAYLPALPASPTCQPYLPALPASPTCQPYLPAIPAPNPMGTRETRPMIRSRNNDSAIKDAEKNQKAPTLSAYTSQKPPKFPPTKNLNPLRIKALKMAPAVGIEPTT
jgi:hypothetical protein